MWPYSWLGNLGLFIIASWADGNFGQKLTTPVYKNLWIRGPLLKQIKSTEVTASAKNQLDKNGRAKIVKNCRTSFMDDPLVDQWKVEWNS